MSYVQYLQQQLRELRIRMQSTAEERVICTAAEAAAVMSYACTTVNVATYGMYYVQYLQQQLLWSYLSTQLRCGSSYHRILPEFL